MGKRGREIVITVLTAAVIILAGMNSIRFFLRIDMTEHRTFSISQVSRELFRELDQDLHITYYLSRKLDTVTPVPSQVKDLLAEYAAYSRNRIRIAVTDPYTDGKAESIQDIGVTPRQIEVIDRNEKTYASVYSGIVIEYLDRIQVLPFVLSIESLEYDLTLANRTMIRGGGRTVAVVVGDSDRSLDSDYQALSAQLERRFEVIDIPRGDPIGRPDALIVLGGRDLDESACRMIDEYITGGGRALFCVDGVDIDMRQNLTARPAGDLPVFDLLEHYGVRIRREIVYDESARDFRLPTQLFGGIAWQIIGRYPAWVAVTQRDVSETNPVTARFAGVDLLWASPLEYIGPEGIERDVLLSSSPRAWASGPPFDTNPYTQSGKPGPRDRQGKFVLAYGLSGSFSSPFEVGSDTVQPSQIVVIGDSDFATGLIQYSDSAYNLLFLENLAEWLSNDEDLMEIRTRVYRDVRLNRIQDPEQEKRTYSFIVFLNAVLIPLLVVLFAVRRFHVRRKSSSVKGAV